MLTLGLNAYHGDAAAALFRDGELVAAVEEERLNRVKHCAGFPARAVRACLELAAVTADELTHAAVSRDPRANLLQKAARVLDGSAPLGRVAGRLANAGRVRNVDEELAAVLGRRSRLEVQPVEHHRAHLASAFYCSPFDDAAVLSIDGFGDFVSTMWAYGRGSRLEILGAVGYPHSLGLLYTATSQWLGFPHYGDEGKVMGLAPYGAPTQLSTMRRICFPTDDGFRLDTSWLTHTTEGVSMSWDEGSPTIGRLFSDRFVAELGPPRAPDAPLTDRHRDVAASLQALTEEIVIHLARLVQRRTRARRLCLAGGVALNSVANGKLRGATAFEEIYVQPAAGDAGTALGAALWLEHMVASRPRRTVLQHPATGPAFDAAACEAAIAAAALEGATVERLDEATLLERAAAALADGEVVGWFQGRMEFGPRALGNRSMLADPRRPEMKDLINARMKRREPFRPFAPSVLADRAAEWFEDFQPSPAMLMVLPIRAARRAEVPAITHVDGTGRLQTVARADHPLYYDLIAAFARRTGVPMLLNTSFNENEPIVCRPDEALACFSRTGLDRLALGPFLLTRPR